jgi:hypothetical protein
MNGQEPPEETVSLIPPHPNLGPELLQDSSRFDAWSIATALAIVALLSWVIWRFRTRRKQSNAEAIPGHLAPPDTPAAAVDAFAQSVRTRIITRFGETWRARTTEQIAGDPGIAEALGPDEFAKLVTFLREVDVLKYSGHDDTNPEAILARWSDWAAHFVAEAAGARSATTAK